MRRLTEVKPKPAESRAMPALVRMLILGIACFAVILVVVIIGARRNWFQTAFSTGDAAITYQVTEQDTEDMTDMPSASATAMPTLITASPEATVGNVAVLAYSTLSLGDDNSAVIALQARLMELGYMDYDEPSSMYNEVTQSAVQAFQRAMDIETTGIADNDLQSALFSENAQKYQVKLYDSGSDVRSIQLRLTELGYYEDKASGYYGPKTESAVMLFQSYNSLPVTGLLSYNAWQSLYSSSAVEAPVPVTPTPTPRPTPKPTKKPTAKPSSSGASTKTQTPQTDAPAQAEATPATEQDATDSPTEHPTEAPTPASGGGSSSYAHSVDGIVSCAKDQLGKPYITGDEGPNSFDCSGLVYFCLRSAGVSVSRIKSTSYASKSNWTLIESIDALQKGDVICFKSDDSDKVNHVAICTGGSGFIHASASKGAVVKSSFSSDASKYWNRNFVCGRRPIG